MASDSNGDSNNDNDTDSNNILIDGDNLLFRCPHCLEWINVHKKDINCKIFRHAAYRLNMKPINPHASKQVCDSLVEKNLVYGCANPFILVIDNDKSYRVEKCEYI